MLKYLADVIFLVILCSIPYVVSWLRLHSNGSRKTMYDSARYTIGICNDQF